MGRVRASELDFEMIVLSRSKKAASTRPMVGHAHDAEPNPACPGDEGSSKSAARFAPGRWQMPGKKFGKSLRSSVFALPRLGYTAVGAETHSPPCAFCG